jgi:hypothetical protein
LNWDWVTGMVRTFFRRVFRKAEAPSIRPALVTVPKYKIGGQS